jgi:hypothetical protein
MPKAIQKLSAEEQLDIAIKSAASDASPKMTSREVAQEFYESNRSSRSFPGSATAASQKATRPSTHENMARSPLRAWTIFGRAYLKARD